MKILIQTAVFHPSVGGLEMFVSTLAGELVRLGQQVKLVVRQPDESANGHFRLT